MTFKPHETPHSGFRLLCLIFTGLLLSSSLLTFLLSTIYVAHLRTQPMKPQPPSANFYPDYSAAWYIFYGPFLPLVSLTHLSVELFFLFRRRFDGEPWKIGFRALCVLGMNGLWGLLIYFWWVCDEGCVDACPQAWMKGGYYNQEGSSGGIYWPGGQPSVTVGKLACGHIVFAL